MSEAEAADAADHSAYDYWIAREYLDKAREEAGGGSYEDAIHYAQEARRHATEARDQSRTRMRDELHAGSHSTSSSTTGSSSGGHH